MATKHAGKAFGRLTVLDGWVERSAGGHPKQLFKVRCSCGEEYTASAVSVLYSKTRDVQRCSKCAAQEHAEKSATGYKHPLFAKWQAMIQRCHYPDAPHYKYYGARGIYVCSAWRGARPDGELATVDGFHKFLADMGLPPTGTSLDRIDNDGPYDPDNCRWATRKTQQNNRRNTTKVTLSGRTLSVTEWGELLKHPRPSLWAERAVALGVPLETALVLLVSHYPKPVGKWKKIFAAAITSQQS